MGLASFLLVSLQGILVVIAFSVEPDDSNSDMGQARRFKNESMCATQSDTELVPICHKMVPQNGQYPPQPASTCPWQIYTYKEEIQQFFSHPVVLGSENASNVFNNFMLCARVMKEDGSLAQHVGHFEYQWDAIPVCCYPEGRNYSYEGTNLRPNLLLGAYAIRQQTPNQTVLWTAPRSFEGTVVFTATFWLSGRIYWTDIQSKPVTVVNRTHHAYFFKG